MYRQRCTRVTSDKLACKRCLVAFMVFMVFVCYSDEYTTTVTTKFGEIRGLWSRSTRGRLVACYLGVPYAEPPVGDLRFRSPKPWTRTWDKTFVAIRDGSMCVQTDKKGNVIGSEDCLYLNIYVPMLSEKREENAGFPVMVFVYGGSYVQGSGDSFELPPDYLMDQNVILVTINYRLNILGFLSTASKASPGNYGLKDIVMALRWVHENIAPFHGDPNAVTLWGHSVGAGAVHALALSNKTEGLFNRYIIQSGSAFSPWNLNSKDWMRKLTLQTAKILKCLPRKAEENKTEEEPNEKRSNGETVKMMENKNKREPVKIMETKEEEEMEKMTETKEEEEMEKMTETKEEEEMEKMTETKEEEEMEKMTETKEEEEMEKMTDNTEKEETEKMAKNREKREMEKMVKSNEKEETEKMPKDQEKRETGGMVENKVKEGETTIEPEVTTEQGEIDLKDEVYTEKEEEEIMWCLRNADVTQMEILVKHYEIWTGSPCCIFGPTIEEESEDAILTMHPLTAINNKYFRDIPFIIGVVEDEGLAKTMAIIGNETAKDELIDNFETYLPLLLEYHQLITNETIFADANEQFYFDGNVSLNLLRNITQMTGDALMLWPACQTLKHQSEIMNSSTYFYLFSYEGTFTSTFSTGRPIHYGVSHTDDLNYLIPILNQKHRDLLLHNTEGDITMINIMTEMWASFAATGVPKAWKVPAWPEYRDSHKFLKFGNEKSPEIFIEDNFFPERMAFWEKLTANLTYDYVDLEFLIEVSLEEEGEANNSDCTKYSKVFICLSVIFIIYFS